MLQKIDLATCTFNPFDKIGKQWMLITSGSLNNYNTMTASWGMMGFIWRKPVINIVVRKQRYTYEFVEKNDLFTVSFYPESYKKALTFCGTKSGRDVNKAKECNLTPMEFDNSVAFAEAEMVFVCKKQYVQDLQEDCFLDKTIADEVYPQKDFHRSYVGEIIAVYKNQ